MIKSLELVPMRPLDESGLKQIFILPLVKWMVQI